MVKEITVQELHQMMESKEDFQLIDVREPYEFDIVNLQGVLIPLADIPQSVDKIDKSKKVVVHCRSGARSASAIEFLEREHGFSNLYNLKGGVVAWASEIDTSLPVY